MFYWCAYCLKYQKEVEPFGEFSTTHGYCGACVANGVFFDDIAIEKVRITNVLFLRLLAQVKGGSKSIHDIFDEAEKSGISLRDFLLGILQPVLYKIGERWEQKTLTTEDEHRFSRLVEGLLEAVQQRQNSDFVLGSRRLAEVVKIVSATRPRYLGVSVALLEQLPALEVFIQEFEKSIPNRLMPQIIVGGFAFHSHSTVPPGTQLCNSPQDLIDLLVHSKNQG